ncbi:MAG: InlB B-repeat-containing protein, partial [Kiritimatiellae bacterium]|nr:InlB B-repeat-containing protein [Kiritimatiellia bacterium]
MFTITFDANGGVGGGEFVYEFGETLETFPSASREGYSFSGWYDWNGWQITAPMLVTGDAEYLAEWHVNTYGVTFDSNGGWNGWSEEQEYGSAITAPEVYRDGYEFVGWQPEVAAVVPASNVTYVAQWRAKMFTITFDANGGYVSPASEVCIEGYSVEFPEPTRTSAYGTWHFNGWYDAREGGNHVSRWQYYPASNITLYAHWWYQGYDGRNEEPRLAYDAATGYVWRFALCDDGTAEITGVDDIRPGVLRIPASVVENTTRKAYSVTSIGNHVFEDMEEITSVVLPDSVTRIGYGAFNGSGITSLTIPSTVRGFSIEHCRQLETLIVQSPYCNDDCVEIYDCPKLKTLTLPTRFTNENGDSAPSGDWEWWADADDGLWHGVEMRVGGLSALESLIVPENVTRFDISACQNLSAISFPSTLRDLDCGFWGLWNLDKVVFSGPVPGSGTGEDGAITSGGLLELLCYANSVYYPEEYADQWKKILRNYGYGGTHGVYSGAAVRKMLKMVSDAPMYANRSAPDFGPFVVGIAAEQTMPSAVGFEMSGVPKGLEWDSQSGTLSGVARSAGAFTVVLSNGTAVQSMAVRIDPSSADALDGDDTPETEEAPVVCEEPDGAAPGLASVYDGYLYNKENGALAGTIQIKVGKPNKNTGLASVKATLQLTGQKKLTLKAVEKGKAQ